MFRTRLIKRSLLFLPAIFFMLFFSTSSFANQLPIGYFDAIDPSSYACKGWAKDPDTPNAYVDIHFYIDGPAGSGKLIGSTKANIFRSDVGAHAFSWVIPSQYRTGTRQIWAYAIDTTGGPNDQLSDSPLTIGDGPSGDQQISNAAGNSTIVIRTSTRFAGAIESVTWNGKEFIDKYDHGRLLQSACSFEYQECYNPTEGGSMKDGNGPTSTSVLRQMNAGYNALESTTQMAFWGSPGELVNKKTCGYAVNTTNLSNHLLYKKVEIGLPGMAHVIKYSVDFMIPDNENHSTGTFEILTGYMTVAFNRFFIYDPASQIGPTEVCPGGKDGIYQEFPLIFYTENKSHAMGIYTKKSNVSYGRFDWIGQSENCVKWNCNFVENDIKGGNTHSFVAYVIVGSWENVKASMDQLYQSLTSHSD